MNSEFIAMLDYLEREKGIKREMLIEAISTALIAAAKKSFSISREVRIDINPKSGQIRAFATPLVVEVVTNPQEEITLSRARQVKKDAVIGDEVEVEVTPSDFGRIAAQTARQAITQRIRQIEKNMIYEEFKDRAGEIVSGTVRRFERSDVMIDLGKFEAVMPSRERVSTEEYNIGDRIRAYVLAVENGIRGPEIILSRSHPNFIRRLFEIEVSEIGDRTVEIRSIAREAGFRTKIAVFSSNEKIDPVGACVGVRGARVKNIVRELNNEKVDIIRWYEDPKEFIKEAMKPTRLKSIEIDEPAHTIRIAIEKEELALAIGKRGQNARLTSRLLGWELDISEDRSAVEVFEQQMAGAAHQLATALGVTEKEAKVLADGGMNSLEVIVTAEASDIAELLPCELERAEAILQAAKQYLENSAQ
ncbi:MAG: transcription termination/antitermination protein NusA [Verrucomicrobia bacterium]|jgi:N utilization substance protein A|nr:MAG: transcription termination/antitermination protein NusA [Verrucomicrobiota bacterium]MDH4469796.1 transcription termination factor NusA [Verrucomicrobiae bacterium]